MNSVQPKPTAGWHVFILTFLFSISLLHAAQLWHDPQYFPSKIIGKPVVHSSFVYILSDAIYKVSLQTAKRTREFNLPSSSSVPMTSSDNLLFYGTDNGHIYATVFRTSALKWEFLVNEIDENGYVSKLRYLTYSNNILYAIFKRKVIAISTITAKELWREKLTDAISADSDKYGVYIADGDYIKFYTSSGNYAWFANVGPVFMTRPNKNTISDKVYVASTKGFISSIDASDGNQSWSYLVNGWPMSTPVFDDKNVYFGSNENQLFAVNKKTGRKLWNTNIFGAVWSEPLLIKNSDGRSIIIIGTNNDSIIALNTKDGQILWNYKTQDWVATLTLVKDKLNTILATTNSGQLLALYPSPICTLDYPRSGDKVTSEVDLQLRAWAWNGIKSVSVLINGIHQIDISTPKDVQFNYTLDTSGYELGTLIDIQCIAQDKNGLLETVKEDYKTSITKSSNAQKAKMILAIPRQVKPETEFTYYVRNKLGTDLSSVVLEFNGKNDTISSPAKLIAPKIPGRYNITAYVMGYEPQSKTLVVKEDLGIYMLLGGVILMIVVVIGFILLNKKR